MAETIPVPVWVVLVFAALFAVREYFAMARDRAMRDLWSLYVHASESPRKASSQVNWWQVLLRVAPKAKIGDLSDALYEQGNLVVIDLVPREIAEPLATEPTAPPLQSAVEPPSVREPVTEDTPQ